MLHTSIIARRPAWELLLEASVAKYKAELEARKPKPWRNYEERSRVLSGLCIFKRREIDDTSRAGRNAVLAKLERRCRKEVTWRDEMSWHYDRCRHAAVVKAYQAERLAVDAMGDVRRAA